LILEQVKGNTYEQRAFFFAEEEIRAKYLPCGSYMVGVFKDVESQILSII
jgi:hypothetical protein